MVRTPPRAVPFSGTAYQPPRLTPPQPNADSAEQSLVRRASQGDRDAFGALVQAHLERAVRLAMRVVHNQQDAEDVVQDAFLQALRAIDRFDGSRPFWPWLARIVVNRAIDVSNAGRVRLGDALTPDLADRGPQPDAMAADADLLARVRSITGSMPARQRLVVEMHDLDGAGIAEIAALTGTSAATVRWHLHMGRRTLRSALAPLYKTEE
jgi:RNA polymerase sigma-70 factor, ECF subfamily